MTESFNSLPTGSKNRIQEMDIWRGFAILGIFMVNILVMNVSFAYRAEWEAEQTGWLNRISIFILETFFYSKFFTIFSLLFGMGVALQLKRSKEKGDFSNSFYLRRFSALFIMGALHIVLIWAGDILHLYGLLGLLLLLFFKLSPRAILWLSVLVFLFPFYSEIVEFFLLKADFNSTAPLLELSRQDILELKHHGSYLSGVELRLKEYSFAMALIWAGIAPVALSMMLLGGYLVKKGFLENVMSWLNRVKWYLFGALFFLLVYRFVLLFAIFPNYDIPFGSALSVLLITVFQLSDVAISLSLLWILAYAWNKGYVRKLIAPLQFVGRMALTNYILQSLIAYLIMRTFNGYEQFSAFQCILIVIVIYGFQIILSKQWFRFYKYGPLEWCWRCISYWKILPFK